MNKNPPPILRKGDLAILFSFGMGIFVGAEFPLHFALLMAFLGGMHLGMTLGLTPHSLHGKTWNDRMVSPIVMSLVVGIILATSVAWHALSPGSILSYVVGPVVTFMIYMIGYVLGLGMLGMFRLTNKPEAEDDDTAPPPPGSSASPHTRNTTDAEHNQGLHYSDEIWPHGEVVQPISF